MRLFIAINLSEEVRASIVAELKEFRRFAPQVKWIRDENLHITLKFLGETDGSKLSLIEQSLRTIKSNEPITLTFSSARFVLRAKGHSIVWVEIHATPNLEVLVAEIEKQMDALGFPSESRRFVPHLTLARVARSGPPWGKVPSFPEQLLAHIRNSPLEFGGFNASQFHLIESKLKSTGAEYTTLQTFSFVTEAER